MKKMHCTYLKPNNVKLRVFYYIVLLLFLLYIWILNRLVHERNKISFDSDTLAVLKTQPNNHSDYVEQFYMQRKSWKTSNLGSILFKNVDPNDFHHTTNKSFIILVWKYYKWLENRHIFGFDSSRKDPLNQCGVKNCKFIGLDSEISEVDVVLVHLQHGVIPNVKKRNTSQRWVFLTDESPKNVFSLAARKPKLSELSDVFNWSMSYRVDSDVPVPYGRTIPLPKPVHLEPSSGAVKSLIPYWKTKRRETLVTILMSNCVPYRMIFLEDLQKHLSVDVYGKCSNNGKTCPGHFRSDCKVISNYLFYLVMENSICEQYFTEKAFYHAYSKGAIPVIIGPSIQECRIMLPPKSFLHIESFESMKHLAEQIITIARNETMLLSYHQWRNYFEVVNEHGYFDTMSYHYCRLCEALNYNDNKTKVYNETMLSTYLVPDVPCHSSSSILFST